MYSHGFSCDVLREAFVLSCPRCNATQDARNHSLYRQNNVCSMHCKSCTSTKWLCICRIPWITCPACRKNGFVCRTPTQNRKRRHPATCAANQSDAAVDFLSCQQGILGFPRASKRVKRPPPPRSIPSQTSSSSFCAATSSPSCSARATASTMTTPTNLEQREGAFTGDEPRSKRRLIFTPGLNLMDRFSYLV